MAERHGVHGGVYKVTTISGSTVTVTRLAKTTDWQLTQLTELVEIRKHGANWITRLRGARDWNASVGMSLDLETANQTILPNLGFLTTTPTLGTLLVAFYIKDNTTGGAATIPRFQGISWVSQIQAGSPADGGQTLSVDLSGQGTLSFIT